MPRPSRPGPTTGTPSITKPDPGPEGGTASRHEALPPREGAAGVRLQKLLAEAGIASRRGAERLIRAGRVSVNGQPVSELGTRADPGRDRISVDGRDIAAGEPKRYVLLHKPPGYLTTREDPRGRPLVFDLLAGFEVRLHPVGRLDYDAEGLLLLTNDGAMTYRLTHPRHGVRRVYEVLVEGRVDPPTLAALRRGVLLEDGPARVEVARRLRGDASGRTWLALTLAEGRYHEVKRLCRAVGLRVCRLVRVAFGPLALRGLAAGCWRELTRAELAALGAPVPSRVRSRRDAAGPGPAGTASLARGGPLHYTR